MAPAGVIRTVPGPAHDQRDTVRSISDFMSGFSLEATRPAEDEVAALTRLAPRGTLVYLSAGPRTLAEDAVASAKRLRARGFEPVPHVAVRAFASTAALDAFLARMVGEAGVRRVLVIAGDRAQPAGGMRSAIELIDGGLLQRRGIAQVGIAGYPQGHPRLSQQELDRALIDKLAAAEATGIKAHIVTQFCFDPAPIVAWIGRLRDFGLEHPVRIGLAGPTNLASLLHYARRCGVCASAQSLVRQAGLARQLFAMSAPDGLVRTLAQAREQGLLGAVKPHFFSFGGLSITARWAAAAAERRVTLEAGQGFRVEPVASLG